MQVVHSKKRPRRSSSKDSDGESSQAIQNNNSYSVVTISGRQDLPNIDQTPTEQVDQTSSDINRELKPPPIFIPGVKYIREFYAMIEQVAER